MQLLQIFNEFAWLVHVGILDGVKENKFKAFVELQFLKLNKKRIALICFIEITSLLAHPKTQLNQVVKPYSINVVTFVKEAASNFLLWDFKNEIL